MFSLWEEEVVCTCASLFRGWLGWLYFWVVWLKPPIPPRGGNEPEDKQRLAWNFMHWESGRAYIRQAWSFVIVNLYIYGCKYVIRRRVLSISLWLGCALWHIDQFSRRRGTGGRPMWLRPWLWTSAKAWPWMPGSFSASLVISPCRGIKGT